MSISFSPDEVRTAETAVAGVLTWALKQAIETNEMSLDEASATT